MKEFKEIKLVQCKNCRHATNKQEDCPNLLRDEVWCNYYNTVKYYEGYCDIGKPKKE